jgi:ABC-type Fe3+/spermidine/putrescine transport system ATPase subunit
MKKDTPLLEARELSKTFEGQKQAAVSSQNLQLQQGEVVALVGGSGSGKTTLLRMLAGLEEPDTGLVLFRGIKVKGPSGQLVAGHPAIRLVHQHFELAHRLSVYDNVTQKLRHLPREEQKEQTNELLAVCHLRHLGSQKVEALSGGEKQRLALARTLAEAPELLLLDEPFSNLDPVLKEEIREALFTYIRRQGIAALLVSHDPKDALSLADTIWVLQEGKLLQKGSPQEIYYKAVSPAVARLFGKLLIVEKDKLASALCESVRSQIRALPGELLGIRPEVWELVGAESAQAEVKILKLFFYGASSEAMVALGNLNFSVYLPPFITLQPSEGLPIRLKLAYILHWKGEKISK